jgi:AcrR family transcriptional regulator
VAATQGLLAAGATPSVSEIAEAADVSRRTVYQHFPTLDQLLLDATIGQLSEAPVSDAIEAADPGGGAEKRVAAMVRALCGQSSETLSLGRSLLALTISSPPADDGPPRRGYRRIAWIEQALEPLRGRVDEAAFERLVSSLSMVVGWEALIVLQDVRGLDPQARIDTSVWAAQALIEATLREAGG